MKAIIRTLFVILFTLALPLSSYADEGPEQPSLPGMPLKKKKPGEDEPFRPQAPAVPQMFLFYDSITRQGVFTLPCDVEYIDIAAENMESHVFYTGSASVDNPVWEQPLPVGEYYIECTADNGDIYAGYIYI